MNRHLQNQPLYSINVVGISSVAGLPFGVVDLAPYVSRVEYEESPDMLRSLVFTIDKYGELILGVLSRGQTVKFVGGTLVKNAEIFNGTITRIKTSFDEDGSAIITVEALSTAWNALGKEVQRHFTYPALGNSRFNTNSESMKISEIVAKIAEEYGIKLSPIKINKEADKQFSLKNALHQKGTSDWVLLLQLAKIANASVWTEFVDGEETLFFVDRSIVRNTPGNISFVYASREPKRNYGFHDIEFTGHKMLRNVTIDEDIDSITSVSYASTRWDFETGEEKSNISEVVTEDGKRKIIYYELDEAAVEALERTNPRMAKALRDMGITGIPWRIAKNFYKQVTIIDEDSAMYDQAFYGITITAETDGDIDIRSQKAYNVYGILRYSSKSREDRLWLYSLRHIWDSEGFITELTFRQ